MIDILIKSWPTWEPILGWFSFIAEMVAVISAGIYFYRQWRAKRARYSLNENGHAWLVVQVGHPVAAAFREQFGVDPNFILDPEVELGHLVMEGEKDYEKMIRRFREFLKAHQHEEIRVITSGPTAFNCLLGQAAGIQYDVVWYQWDLATKSYSPVPTLAGVL